MSAKQTMDCCQRDGCKHWSNSFCGNCRLDDEDFEDCRQINYYEPLATIRQQPLYGSPDGSPKCRTECDTSHSGERCMK